MFRTQSWKRSSVVSVVLVAIFLSVGWAISGVLGTTAVYSANSTLYAAPNNQGNGNCSSWGNACRLSTALNQATSGDEIWVKEGTHYPTTSTSDISATLQLSNGIALYGGFDGSESQRGDRDWAQNLTVLSGDIEKNDSDNSDDILTDPDDIVGLNSYHVLMAVDLSETAVLDGFTITAGSASSSEPDNGLSHDRGGGLYSQNSQVDLKNISFIGNQAIFAGGALHSANSDITIENVTFDANFAIWDGGALNGVLNSDLTIDNSSFSNNVVGVLDNMATGGGVFISASELIISDSTFDNNSTTYHGGAAYHFSNTTATYNDVIFINNSAENGAAVYNRSASPVFNRARFQANEATEFGGVMYNYFNADPIINNSLLSGNFATLGGGAIFNFFNSDPVLNAVTVSSNETDGSVGGIDGLQNSNPVIVNSIFWNNRNSSGTGSLTASINNPTGSVEHSIIQGSGGSSSWNSQAGSDLGGNLDLNPNFVNQPNAASAPTTAGDFNLQENSPAVNAGDNAAYDAITSGSTDLAGNARKQNSVIDMGAYETAYAPSSYPLTIELIGNGSGEIELNGDAISCDSSCTIDLDIDTAVTLIASPDQGSNFEGWGGDCDGTGSCELTMDSAKSVTAEFDIPPVLYPLSIEIIGTGSGDLYLDGALLTCNGSCTVEFLEDTAVSLTATPDANSTFAGWSGDCGGSGSCNLTMDSPKQITANFHDEEEPLTFPLSIEVVGTGDGELFLNGDPLTCNNSCTIDFDEDTAVSLTATPDGSSLFAGWSGDCSGNGSCNLTMNEAKEVTANFNDNSAPLSYPLSIDLIGSGDGQLNLNGSPLTCDGSCTVVLEEDTAVTLTATPDGNSTFAGWGGDCQGQASCVLTMTEAKEITASFISNDTTVSYSLTIGFNGNGDGQIYFDGSPLNCDGGCSVVLEEDTAVLLTATADSGSTFSGWGGACSGSGSCELTMDSAKEVTATFELDGPSSTEFMIYLPLVVR